MDNDILTVFRSLLKGFGRHHAVVYSALLKKGCVTARELSNETGIQRELVYRALKGLTIKGMARKEGFSPSLYSPAKPEETIDRLIENKRKKLTKLRHIFRKFLDTNQRPEIIEIIVEKNGEAKAIAKNRALMTPKNIFMAKLALDRAYAGEKSPKC